MSTTPSRPDTFKSPSATNAVEGGWPAVVSLALGSFALVLSEFLPIGLLPAIADEFDIEVGTAGLMVFGTGLAAAVGAPLITVLTSRIDRRTAVVWLTVLLVAADLLGAFAGNVTVLLFARVLLGISVGGFWAIGAGLAGRLVSAGSVIRATSLITAGISIATVLSLPLGSLVSAVASWRAAFVIGAMIGLVALICQIALLPRIPALNPARWSALTGLMTSAPARAVLLVCAFVFVAQFTAYTYVTQYLEDLVHLDASAVTIGLLVLGVAGIAGNALASVTLSRSVTGTILVVLLLLIVSLIALPLVVRSVPAVFVLLICWGIVWGALPLGMQTWILRESPSATEGTLAMFVAVVQLAIAVGSLVGGIAVGVSGLSFTFFLAGSIAAAGVVVLLSLPKRSTARVN